MALPHSPSPAFNTETVSQSCPTAIEEYLKLYINGAAKSQYAIRKVAISRLIEDDGDEIKFEKLRAIATEYAYEGQPMEGFDVFVTYTDSEKETVTLSSDHELVALLEEKSRAQQPLRLNVRVVRKMCIPPFVAPISNQNVRRSSQKLPPPSGLSYKKPLQVENLELFVDTVAKALVSAFVSVRQHFPPPSGHDRGCTIVVPARKRLYVKSECKIFDPNFIHRRHTCDGCDVTPILGYRYHASNIPDLDFCQACKDQCISSAIRFERVQEEEHEQENQSSPRRRIEAIRARRVGLVAARRRLGGVRRSLSRGSLEAVDAAIERSLRKHQERQQQPWVEKDTQTEAVVVADAETSTEPAVEADCIVVDNVKIREADEDDWNMVEDTSFAFATKLIGSALFNADLSNSNCHSPTRESLSLSCSHDSSLSLISCNSFSSSDEDEDKRLVHNVFGLADSYVSPISASSADNQRIIEK
uniref:ZZ-type domain-containing protein n=1 Tax=Corethron hystrix TaxID=216773 RepID=A0A7S1BYR0_9STRA|mmetsp:Transcript_5557/g.11584  ORF Transcript_5557/g.11584 Transcript_5557/m.11584 type:complete len:473 (+) Transcript_5557:101-1519(+)